LHCLSGSLTKLKEKQPKQIVWAAQFALAADPFNQKVNGTAWSQVSDLMNLLGQVD
jgi:hypothetical protein